MKYKEWLDKWLENYVAPQVKARTLVRYREIVNQHLSRSLGEYELSELTAYELQCYITELLKRGNLKTEEGLAPNSVNSIITLIQNSLKMAHTLGLCSEYLGDKIKRPRARERQIECFTVTEQKKIEHAAMNDRRGKMFGVVFCLYTGMRIGELLALEWGDINFVTREITIRRSCHDGIDENGSFCRITDTPKTPSSIRIIPLPKQLVPKLRERKKLAKSQYVIEDSRGFPLGVRSYQQSFRILLEKHGIKRYGFHSLRHTFATRAIECGMDVRTLSEILGHKNPSVTLKRYVHSLFAHTCEMMNKLGRLLV